jgi:hypothetical protein
MSPLFGQGMNQYEVLYQCSLNLLLSFGRIFMKRSYTD